METTERLSLFWKLLEADWFRCFVVAVLKLCKTAKTVSFQMLPISENIAI